MIRIYNTFTRRKEIFRPRQGKKVRMFVCGPTVYDLSHIGHGRTYLIYDALARYLRLRGFFVTYLQNITDIDDKIIARAKYVNRPWKSVAREFERAYLLDMARLGISSVDQFARATDYIPQIVKQVKTLKKKGSAYEIAGDGYYFDLKTFPRYGKLSRRTVAAAEDAVSRIDESVQKRNKGDFCLWKSSKPDEPVWCTGLGNGRPGWHIEDTAITGAIFGSQYDIHGGGIDLMFPHHESEIAQMEAASGKTPLVKYWAHAGHLTVRGKKMSKSLGNFITIRDLVDTWPPEIFRLFVFSTHYRSSIDYDEDLMAQSASAWERLTQFAQRIGNLKSEIRNPKQIGNSKTKTSNAAAVARRRFFAALDDDFDTPRALAAIFELIRRVNPALETGKLNANTQRDIASFLAEANAIFGILPQQKKKTQGIPKNIATLIRQRERLRAQKKYSEADAVRRKIADLGFSVEDTTRGSRVKRLGI